MSECGHERFLTELLFVTLLLVVVPPPLPPPPLPASGASLVVGCSLELLEIARAEQCWRPMLTGSAAFETYCSRIAERCSRGPTAGPELRGGDADGGDPIGVVGGERVGPDAASTKFGSILSADRLQSVGTARARAFQVQHCFEIRDGSFADRLQEMLADEVAGFLHASCRACSASTYCRAEVLTWWRGGRRPRSAACWCGCAALQTDP